MNKVKCLHRLVQISFLLLISAILILPNSANAQNAFERALRLKLDSLVAEKGVGGYGNQTLLPNNSVQSIMTPTGWGGGNSTYAFVVVGGVFPAMYTNPNTPDLVSAVGISGGNSKKFINASVSFNITRVSELRDYSVNIILSRQLFKGSSIAVGGLQMFADPKVSDAPDASYYVAFSRSAQGVKSRTEGYSGLSYTIGYGVGRFLYKSPLDVANGKGKYGTGFFANVSYEVLRQVNLNAEWSGMNLGFSSGIRPLRGSALTFGFGIYSLTKYSGDRVQFLGSLGLPISLKKIEKPKDRAKRLERERELNKKNDRTPPNFRGGENGLIIRN